MFFAISIFVLYALVSSAQVAVVTDLTKASENLDPLTEQTIIDQVAENCMIYAPVTINLLGQAMVVASKVDVSFRRHDPNVKYQYIKHPESFGATLLQVSNDGYRAFLGAHNAMNRIRLYMQQVPQHIKTIIKLMNSTASSKLVERVLPKVIDNINRISNICVQLAEGTESAFQDVMSLLGEILEATKSVKGKYEGELADLEIERNSSMVFYAEMKKIEAQREKHYAEMKEAVQKAREQYDRALKEIPTGFKALLLNAGKTFLSLVQSAGPSFVASKMGMDPMGVMMAATMNIKNRNSEKMNGGGMYNPGQAFQSTGVASSAKTETVASISHFAASIQDIITKIKNSGNTNNIDPHLIQSLRIICNFFGKIISQMPGNPVKEQADALIQQTVELIDQVSQNVTSDLLGGLTEVLNELKPFVAAVQLSNQNQAPIDMSDRSGAGESTYDNSQNEVLKARIYKERLSQVEQRLDAFYADHMAALERTGQLVGKLAKMDLTKVHFDEIIKMLHEAFKYLAKLREQWHFLVEFFSHLSARMKAGFHETLKSFLIHARQPDGVEIDQVDRSIILYFLVSESGSVHKESFLQWVMSRTYFEVSQKYIMPRLAGLSMMMTARDDHTRNVLLQQLGADTTLVQEQVKTLVNHRRKEYMQLIDAQKQKVNEKINNESTNGYELDVIEDAKKLLGEE